MYNISSLSFCGGGGETCGSLAKCPKGTNTMPNRTPLNILFGNIQNSRPYVSKQFSNAFDFGAFNMIKNATL